jgi:glycosyltransferase involved in cell wall biosynthesis
LFILPSYYEGLPIALLEAMSCGLSCIVSDIPAHREIDLAEERYFPAGNVKQLSEKLEEFLEKPLTATEKSEQIARVVKKYNWERIAEETLEVYKATLKTPRRVGSTSELIEEERVASVTSN